MVELMNRTICVLLMGVFAAIALMSFLSPYLGDDYIWLFTCYGDSLPEGGGADNGSMFSVPGVFSRIFDMVGVHYMTLNGRVLANFFSGLIGSMSVMTYALCNAVVFTMFVYSFWKTTGLPKRRFALVAVSLIVFLVDYEAVFWRSATSNYLWPALLTLVTAPVFVRCRGSVGACRFCALFLLAFIAAGGNELIDFGICAMLSAYWLACIVRRRRIPLDGRMALSIGFVLGSVSLVFAPGTLHRASGVGMFEFGGSVVFSFAAFLRSLSRCVIACPPLAVVLCFVVWAAVRRRWHLIVGRRYSYLLVCCAGILIPTCFLTDGVGRTSWLLSACSLLVFFMILKDYLPQISDRVLCVASMSLGTLAVGVVGFSLFQAHAARSEYKADLNKWRKDDSGLFVGRQWRLPFILGWFDRTVRLDSLLHYGSGYPNHLVARAFGRKVLIRLTHDMYRTLQDPDGILSERSLVGGGMKLHSVDDVDLIAIPYDGPLAHGSPVQANVVFRDRPVLSLFDRIRLRMTREGATEACKNSPLEDMCGNWTGQGFVYDSLERGRFAVAILNRRVPRNAIADVRIIPLGVPPREVALTRMIEGLRSRCRECPSDKRE